MLSNSHETAANAPYIGRFAPSPTGPLHFGSLLAALASYLDAHSHGGKWLIRMEDLDPPREMLGAQERILEALDIHQLFSDEPIVYQSQQGRIYQRALNQLIKSNLVFPCTCSRKQLNAVNGIHFGNCYSETNSNTQAFAWRFNCSLSDHLTISTDENVAFVDALQGKFKQSLQEDIGDFVVKRKDQLWAYQLAMVVDDYHQGVTHVVRGIDLIDSTLRQKILQTALSYPTPNYAHIPVACAENGQKLSKQNLAPALDLKNPGQNLWLALSWLRQKPPENLRSGSVKKILEWGIAHWDINVLSNIQRQTTI